MATIKTPVNKLKKDETIEHYNAVLLEDIRSKMEAVLEKAGSTEAALMTKMEEVKNDLGLRLDAVEFAVKEHSEEIQGVKEEIHGVKTEMQSMEKRLSDKIDKSGERLDDHEVRITTLETARL